MTVNPVKLPTNVAQRLADLYQPLLEHADSGSVQIYLDAAVHLVRCTADQHLDTRKKLMTALGYCPALGYSTQHPFTEARRGDWSVFVVEANCHDMDRSDFFCWFPQSTGYSDHRYTDIETLAELLELVEPEPVEPVADGTLTEGQNPLGE